MDNDIYRICQNKYGWYKLQLWCEGINFFFFKTKGKWKDTCFRSNSSKCLLFETLDDAKVSMQKMINDDQMTNNDWQCIE